MSDVVVLLPGITGSILGRDVWAPSLQAALGTLRTRGSSIERLAFPPGSAPDVDEWVTAQALMPGVHLVPGLWKIDGYSAIVASLLRTFELRRGRTSSSSPAIGAGTTAQVHIS